MKKLFTVCSVLAAAAIAQLAGGHGIDLLLVGGTLATARPGTKTKKDGEGDDKGEGKTGDDKGDKADKGADGKAAGDKKDGEGADVTLDEVNRLIGKSIGEALKTELPNHLKGMVTEEGLKSIITAEFKRIAGDSTTINREKMGDIVTSTVKVQMDAMRKDKKFVQNPDDAGGTKAGEKSYIEMPVAWTKGNLPVHGKQLLNILRKKDANDGIDEADLRKSVVMGEKTVQEYRSHAQRLEQQRNGKALTSTGSATGDELVHRDLSSELQRRLYLASDLAAILMAREIDMPSQPYDFPITTTRPSFYLETVENTNATGSDPGTGTITLNASKFMGMIEFSYELEEDSIIPILPWVQGQLAEAAADAWEHALINGDDTATHMDTDEELLTKSPAFAFKGFRKLAHAVAGLKSDIGTGGANEANLRAIRKLLKKYAADPRKLMWIVSPTTSLELQAIANVATLEKYGTRATILTGELAALFGIPIIASERMRETLDATGINGASGNTKTAVLLVRTDRFLTGRRRDFTVEVDRNIRSQTHQLVASFRKAFTPIETPSATISSVALGYNVTP